MAEEADIILYTYTYNISGIWTLPADVQNIQIEIWGSGEAYNNDIGHGQYIKQIPVSTKLENFSYTIGSFSDELEESVNYSDEYGAVFSDDVFEEKSPTVNWLKEGF